ncbi:PENTATRICOPEPTIDE REPEAT-CONTAINING PROTEIN [Salix koriyanagi]|uniref:PENTATRICOPEPTIDE REPEAT-CONTAINING PROTEIN n=1 Tax=Salix koriyanagi TaxID=2511006 RepID=A0A9Q0ZSQ0_9ROSI|nr:PENTATRICOPEPTIDE REPEAT-CONTAINING PROTEIN [Salix koriyanagi]
MLERNDLPNKFTYPFVLKACAGIGDLNLGKSIHGSVVKFGFGDEVNVQNTLVHMYCCCRGGEGGVEFARKVFDEMSRSDSVSWSAMIGGYVRVGRSSDAISLFREMQIKGVCPDEITMVSVLSACTALKFVQEMPIDPNPVVWRTLINACRAHGELKLGRKLPDS